jgi:hypothetical protein
MGRVHMVIGDRTCIAPGGVFEHPAGVYLPPARRCRVSFSIVTSFRIVARVMPTGLLWRIAATVGPCLPPSVRRFSSMIS